MAGSAINELIEELTIDSGHHQNEDVQQQRSEELLAAAKAGDAALAARLLADGARHGVTDENGWGALLWASCNGHDAIVEALIEHGAHLEYVPKEMGMPETPHLHAAAHGGAPPPGTNSPIHWAAYKGHTTVFWRLLVAGLSPLDADASGNNALHLAASGGHLQIVQSCLSDGLDPRTKNLFGNAPLQLATAPAVRELLKAAEKAADEGRRFLCSASGAFCADEECIRTEVVDRTSHPVARPVCYSRERADRIMAAEDALARIVEAARALPADVSLLAAAVGEAEAAGASMELLQEGTATYERLSAEIALADELQAIDAQRPLTQRAQLKPLASALQEATAKGADAQLLADTEAAMACMLAEIALLAAHAAAAPLTMAPKPPEGEDEEEGVRDEAETAEAGAPAADGQGAAEPAAEHDGDEPPPPAPPPPLPAEPPPPPEPWTCPAHDCELALKAERACAKLEAMITAAKAAHAEDGLVARSERLLALLRAEKALRDCAAEPVQEGGGEGEPPLSFRHPAGERTSTLLECLTLRHSHVETAFALAEASGIGMEVLGSLEQMRADVKAAHAAEQVLDDERKAKEAAAAAKAARKAKKAAKLAKKREAAAAKAKKKEEKEAAAAAKAAEAAAAQAK